MGPATGGPRTAAPRTSPPRTGPQTAPRTMPPLQGPPVGGDDDVYDQIGLDAPPPRKRPAWLFLVAGLAVLLLIGAAVYLLTRGEDAEPGSPTATTPSTSAPAPAPDSAAPAGFLVATDDYIGDPADDVQRLLEGEGLVVRREAAGTALLGQLGLELGAGTVAGTDPANQEVPAGGAVTLCVAEQGWTPEGEPEEEEPEQPTTEPAPPTRSSAAPTTAAPTTARTTASPSSSAPPPSSTPPPTTSSAPPPADEPPPPEEEPDEPAAGGNAAGDTP